MFIEKSAMEYIITIKHLQMHRISTLNYEMPWNK